MKYLIPLLPTSLAMLWALRSEYKRKYHVGIIALTLCTLLIIIRFTIVSFSFNGIALSPILNAAERCSSLYIIPLMYAYLCDQCGTQWNNRTAIILLLLPLFTLLDNPVLNLGTALQHADAPYAENTLLITFGNTKIANLPLRSAVVSLQCVLVMIRMAVLWVRVRNYGLKFSSRLKRYFAWMFLLLGFTIYSFNTGIHLGSTETARWIYLTFYCLIIITGYLLIPNSFKVRPIVTKDNGQPVELDTFIGRNQHLAERLRAELLDNQAYLQQGLRIEDMAAHIGTNRTYISKLMREEFGTSFTDYVNTARIEYSQQLLLNTDLSLDDIAIKSGFSSAPSYCRTFKRHTSLTPNEWKEQQRHATPEGD